jgi:two-component system, cell cycle sensor histidine kinase and response regulator CckA
VTPPAPGGSPPVAGGFGSTDAKGRPLPAVARALYALVAFVAFVGTVAAVAAADLPSSRTWLQFALLTCCAAIAQLFNIRTGRNTSFHTAPAFVAAAVLLLPPELVALMLVLQHVPDWIKERFPAYIQSFNIANYVVSALAAWSAAHALLGADALGAAARPVAGITAAIVLVLLNHLLLALMLRFGRGHSLRASGLFTAAALGPDLALVALGVALAEILRVEMWLAPALLIPLFLTHRSLASLALTRESEERLRAIFDSAAVGTCLIDNNGVVVSSNRALRTLLGYTENELARVPFAGYTHADDAPEEVERFAELMAGDREEYRLEKRFLAKDGREVWVHVAVGLVRNADGRPQFGIATIDDITEQRRLEEQLRQAQKMEAVGRLAGGIAHDFNNLLTAISGYTALAVERVERGQGVAAQDLHEIQHAATRAAGLTAQLLAFSRKQVLQPKVVHPNELVGSLTRMVRRLVDANIEIREDLAADLRPVRTDPAQLEQALLNLVVNARDAMPEGGTLAIKTLNAEIGAHESDVIPPGSYVVLSVCDTGTGIDDETKTRLFEPFFTTKQVGKGTGLGLAMVYGFVTQSGGYVTVDTETGRGTTFHIYLRAAAGEVEAVPAPDPDREATPAGVERVLLVEDEDIVRRLVRQMLEQAGYSVVEARDGEHALELADAGLDQIDVLLTDAVMPKLGGPLLAEQLLERFPELKVVFMSGYSEEAIVREGTLVPGAHFLQKPFTASDLARALRGALDGALAA